MIGYRRTRLACSSTCRGDFPAWREADVDEARDDLQAAKMRVSDLRDEHEAAGRAIEKLESRATRVRYKALSEANRDLKAEYFSRLKAAVENWETYTSVYRSEWTLTTPRNKKLTPSGSEPAFFQLLQFFSG